MVERSRLLAIVRMRRDDHRGFGWFSPQQIDARNLVLALRQVLRAERLEQAALEDLNIDRAVRDALARAAKRFTDDLPGIEVMRDGLTHFDEWSRGMGRGPQEKRRRMGHVPRDVARDFWRFGYDPEAGTVSFGSYSIDVNVAERAVRELSLAVYQAAREVDKKSTVELRARTVAAAEVTSLPESSMLSRSPVSGSSPSMTPRPMTKPDGWAGQSRCTWSPRRSSSI